MHAFMVAAINIVLCLPALHSMQFDSSEDIVSGPTLPAPHSLQAVWSVCSEGLVAEKVVSLHRPGVHAVHTPNLLLKAPVEHVAQ